MKRDRQEWKRATALKRTGQGGIEKGQDRRKGQDGDEKEKDWT